MALLLASEKPITPPQRKIETVKPG